MNSPELSFTSFDERFLDQSWYWLNDPEIKSLTMTPDFTRDQQISWFKGLPKTGYLIWGVECEGKPIGAVGLKNFRGASAEYFGYIGERDYWGLGLGSKIIVFAFAAAREYGLHRIRIRVRSDNARAIHLYRRSGFVPNGQDGEVLQMSTELSN